MNDNHYHDGFLQGSGSFSVERLVEFGISAAVAGQILRAMNQTMSGSMQQWPSSMQAPQGQPSRLYYAALEGKQAGPFSETEIVRLINDKRISKETLVWYQGMKDWKKAEDVPEILRIIALTPPPLAGAQ